MSKSILVKALFLLAVFSASSILPSISKAQPQENTWTTLAPMSTPRASFDAAVVDGKIYAIGGTSKITEEYDPSTDTWTIKAAIPTARTGLVVTAVQNKIYAIGGLASEYPEPTLAKIEMYDPTTNTWTTKADMPTDRTQMCANNVNDQIYVIGGLIRVGPASADPCNKTEVYNPLTDTWVSKAEMPYAMFDTSSVVVGDRIYVFPSDLPMYDTKFPIQIYDTITDSWSLGSFPPTVQSNAAAVTILDEGGRELIYIFGGGGYGTYLDLVQIYGPQDDVWGVGSPMPTPRFGMGVVVVDNEIYAFGGVTAGGTYGILVSTNERYTPLESGSLLPTPTPTPYPTPEPTPSPEPTPPFTPEPTSTPTEEPQQTELDITAGAVLALSSIVVFLGLLFYFIKRR